MKIYKNLQNFQSLVKSHQVYFTQLQTPSASQHSSRRLIKGFKKLLEFRSASEAINLEWNQVNNLILTALRLTIKNKRSTDDRCDAPSEFPFFSSQKIYGVWLICEVRLIFNTSVLKFQAFACSLNIYSVENICGVPCSDYSLPKLLVQLSKSNKACISSTKYTDLKL